MSSIGPPATPSGAVPPVRLSVRSYFSTHFLWNALHSAGRAEKIESTAVAEPQFNIEHRGAVLSAIVDSVAFLEAAINELFQDASDRHGVEETGYLAHLPPPTVAGMGAAWDNTQQGARLGVLDKWQLLLVLDRRAPLERGVLPYQDAHLLVRLRNALVHYRPEDVAADEQHRLELQLKVKFESNRLMMASGNPWWPGKCLGHGCAAWAVHAAQALADAICEELGILPNYRRIAADGWFGSPP